MSAFDRLHPAVQHHIVNSLGWKSLRPLQEQAVDPILQGEHSILLAPTAGGKTEAAVFPLLSRMLSESWSGLSVLYLCPIKALLNNLEPRLRGYAELLGRRVGIWHGDIGERDRRAIDADPPDILLTTPESVEVMLVSQRREHRRIFAGLRAVVVDEIHAFAGDDRGWHLLSVLERVSAVCGRDLQRVGLSATVGNPEGLLGWLAGSCDGDRRCVMPTPAASVEETRIDVRLDYVGSMENAAKIIAGLHNGEKRLVFVDSRSGVEVLASHLRERKIQTFVSHSSLSVDERRRAEAAFSEGRDCVIVATSTLELGIDVGDLDRVIQINAPATVASFLQRLGRTGRRAGTTRNTLFLATTEGDLLQAAGLVNLWGEGFVEPVVPPPEPYHVLAQQILALSLQEHGLGRDRWADWIGKMPGFAEIVATAIETLIEHMSATAFLFDEGGVISPGLQAEQVYGGRNYLELYSVFTSPPLFRVLFGREEIGQVHESSFQVKQNAPPILLLGGRSWVVTDIDWNRRAAQVQPVEERGRSLWAGSGQALHFDLCRSMHKILLDGEVPSAKLTARADSAISRLLDEFHWVREETTSLVREAGGRVLWWTFAGLRANQALQEAVSALVPATSSAENLCIRMSEDAGLEDLMRRLEDARLRLPAVADPPIADEALEAVKFSECVPAGTLEQMLVHRNRDERAVRAVLGEDLRGVEPV